MQTKIDQLAQWLKAHDDYVLLGHVYPDGDCGGSCMAAAMALRALGKRVQVCLLGGLPKMYGFLPGAEEILTEKDPLAFEPKTAFALDVSEPERLGAFRSLFDGCADRAVIDHHDTNPGFGDCCVIDGDAAATGEMIVALIGALGVKLTGDMAQCLYVAISTDCGQFNYSNTRAETMEAAAELLRAGVDVAGITERLYRTRTKSRTHLLGVVLAGLEVSADGRIAWARLTQRMLNDVGASREDNEGIVNYLLEIDGVQIAVLAEERGNATKFSLRSKGELDVARLVAVPFGGGGHAKAAGCTLEMPMEAALERVLNQARSALNENNMR